MLKPICPKCHSNKNIIRLGVGFRCVFCMKMFFKGDIVDGEHQVQTKLNCNLLEIENGL